ncbi:MAG: hypothetical protein AAFZ15_01570 [Bacteroidota bacterium]
MKKQAIIDWLLKGDISIQYQTYRDLLNTDRKDLIKKIETEGWGKKYLSKRNKNGHWGKSFYNPKWISSHYTLVDLRNLCISTEHPLIQDSINKIAANEKGPDGGVLPIGTTQSSDVCVNGMFLNYASYFKTKSEKLNSIIDFLLSQHMSDGGFNCRSNRSGATHSSLHSSLSVLEGFWEYILNGYQYRSKEIKAAQKQAEEFILMHQLFISDRTGAIIKKEFLKLAFPRRWKYDILSALDYFQYAKLKWDDRMQPAIDVLLKKRNKDGTWNVQAKHPGKIHFEMEKAGKPSRWNTLRALRTLKHFEISI